MGGHQDPSERTDLVVTLFVFDALDSLRHRPLQLKDLERNVFHVLRAAVTAGELPTATFLRYDPSSLFGQLQELRECDFVERKADGYTLTAAGRDRAASWTPKLFSAATAARLREGVTATP